MSRKLNKLRGRLRIETERCLKIAEQDGKDYQDLAVKFRQLQVELSTTKAKVKLQDSTLDFIVRVEQALGKNYDPRQYAVTFIFDPSRLMNIRLRRGNENPFVEDVSAEAHHIAEMTSDEVRRAVLSKIIELKSKGELK